MGRWAAEPSNPPRGATAWARTRGLPLPEIGAWALALPYFVYGWFVLPLAFEAAALLRRRRVTLGGPQLAGLAVAAYAFFNLAWVAPSWRTGCELAWGDFARWRLRELVPMGALVIAAGVPAANHLRYRQALLQVGAVLSALEALEFVSATLGGPTPLGLVRLDISGYYFFHAWLGAHNAAGALFAALAALALDLAITGDGPPWVAVALAAGVLMSGSRSAYLGLVAAALFIAILRRAPLQQALQRRLTTRGGVMAAAGAAMLLAVAAAATPAGQRLLELAGGLGVTGKARIELWEQGVAAFLSNPVWGVGWGNYGCFAVGLFAQGVFAHAHNSYLHVAAELGGVGLVLMGVWLTLLVRTLRDARQFGLIAAFVAIAVSSLLEHNFGAPTVTAPLFVLFG
ncbi:MAG: O-antigen ligase family protein, partial [Bacillota bacterium]